MLLTPLLNRYSVGKGTSIGFLCMLARHGFFSTWTIKPEQRYFKSYLQRQRAAEGGACKCVSSSAYSASTAYVPPYGSLTSCTRGGCSVLRALSVANKGVPALAAESWVCGLPRTHRMARQGTGEWVGGGPHPEQIRCTAVRQPAPKVSSPCLEFRPWCCSCCLAPSE